MAVTLAELARRFHCEALGDAATEIDAVASLASTGPRNITFVADPVYHKHLSVTAAGAVILRAPDAPRRWAVSSSVTTWRSVPNPPSIVTPWPTRSSPTG